jgi:hypothetical protein
VLRVDLLLLVAAERFLEVGQNAVLVVPIYGVVVVMIAATVTVTVMAT